MASCYLCLTNIKILFKYNIFIPKILSYFGWHTFEFKSQNCSILKQPIDPGMTLQISQKTPEAPEGHPE